MEGDLDAAVASLTTARELSTEDERDQVEELLGNLRKAMKDNRRIRDPQEILPGNGD